MLIYILHNDNYYTFRLPKKINGSYVLSDYDIEGEKRSLATVNANDNKWVINSNDNVKITQNNQIVKSAVLVPYNYYLLVTNQDEKILLYIEPGYDHTYIAKKIANDSTSLAIGNAGTSDIVYNSKSIAPKQIELIHQEGRWNIKNLNPTIPMFINTFKKTETSLSNFDTVFIMGLKIVVCGNLIFVNNPNNTVISMSGKLINIQNSLAHPDKVTAHSYTDFYNSEDYFSKSPVFLKRFNPISVPITSPENRETKESYSFLMQMIPSIVMDITSVIYVFQALKEYKEGQIDGSSLMMTLLMALSMLFISFIWPFIERIIENFQRVIREKARVRLYKRYLKQKTATLEKAKNEEKMALEFNYLSLKDTVEVIYKKNTNLFSINAEQDRFMKIKLGTGRIPLDCKIEYTKPDFIKEKDELLDMIDKMISDYKYIEDAPFILPLKENIAFINSNGEYYKYMENIILKLATFHDYNNLKIVAFTNEFSRLNSIRCLNHCWDNERSMRFVANSMQEAEALSSYLTRIFNRRNNSDDQVGNVPHYIIICDDIDKYKNLKIIDEVTHKKTNCGFSLISFSKKLTDVPEAFHYFVDYNDNSATFFQAEMQENSMTTFTPELMDPSIDFEKCLRLLANIPIKVTNGDSQGSLPDKLGFLEMYGVGNVNQLNASNRWKESKIISSLSSPIGIDANNNIIYLDLHEKKHGPHGLIAGMTGSGKSEFIITYILSLAVNYNPDEVQFVLIDYKGGGLAGAFENRTTGIKLPHLVGTITNLDVSEMNRTLVSIKSELERRQKIFNAVKEQLNTGTIDIYKYQNLYRAGVIKEPLSHLFIICDEFAELKQSQPDFMDEIVSTSRIGRSLGIHLILATQKPSGVVDEQVWSNSKFKVCCRVQTVEDSREMIRKDDAAYLKQSGRFYLQVGYDEYYILGQSGYSGTSYIPSETAVSKFDNSISFISDIGEVYKNITLASTDKKNEQKVDLGEELTNIVKYLIATAQAEKFKYHQLWLDNVPELIYYDYIIKKYNVKSELHNIEPVIGEYDNPRNQSQGYVTLPITTGGNTVIIGNSGSGKNSLLSTIIYSSIINHNSDEVNFYIIDLGSEKLKKFEHAPQVGDVLTITDREKIKFLMYMLQAEQLKRQKYYSEHGGDFLYDVKNKKCPFPNIVVIIYDMDVFKETFDEIYDDMLGPFTRNCSKFGINFIITGNTDASMGYIIENNFPQKVLLNINDQSDAVYYFKDPPVIKKNPGRGLIAIGDIPYEFQVPLLFSEDKEVESLQYVIGQLNKFLRTRAKKVPTVPDRVTFETLKNSIKTINAVPLGINIVTAQVGGYNFNNLINLMSASSEKTFFKFLPGFLEVLSQVENTKTIILNSMPDFSINAPDNIKVYASSFKKVIPVLKTNIEKYNTTSDSQNNFVIIVIGYEKLNNHMKELKKEDSTVSTISEIINLSRGNNSFKFILFDTPKMARELRVGEVSNMIDNMNGIWIGKGLEDQELITVNSNTSNNPDSDEIVVTVKNGAASYLKCIR